jgi:hypothetical protein
MKKLLLLLILSLGLVETVSAARCYDTNITSINSFQGRSGEVFNLSNGNTYRVISGPRKTGFWDSSNAYLCWGANSYIRLSRRGEIVTLKVTQINPVSESSSNNLNTSSSTVDLAEQGAERLKKGISQILGVKYETPVGQKNYRLYEFGSTWRVTSNSMYSTDGKRCTQSATSAKCDNGVTYKQCGNSICGSDGTSYTKKGNCRYTSFGATCCGPASKIVCR